MFGNKKNSKGSSNNTPASYEGYGKTEPVTNGEAGGMFFGNSGMDPISKTVPATDPILFNSPEPVPDPGVIEPFGVTSPANFIQMDNGTVVQPVVGWLVCIKGVNLGKEYRLHSDYNYVGSVSGDIVIQGDPKISRERHMVIMYDPENRTFAVSPAAGANIVRLNDKGLVGTAAELKNYDVIRTGDSSFMFIGFCGEKFGWEQVTDE